MAAALLAAPQVVLAQSGALFLLVPFGAHAVGQGEAVSADRALGTEGIWWNPAALGRLDRREVAVHHGQSVIATTDMLAMAVPSRVLGTLAAGAYLVNYGDQEATDPVNGTPIGTITNRSYLLALSYASPVGKRLSAGLSYKFLMLRFQCSGVCGQVPVVSGSSSALDIGAQYLLPTRTPVTLGASLRNVGPPLQMKDAEQADPLPRLLQVGAMADLPVRSLAATGATLQLAADLQQSDALGGTAVGVGAILGYRKELFLRGGFKVQSGDGQGASFGVGYRRGGFAVDFARRLGGPGRREAREGQACRGRRLMLAVRLTVVLAVPGRLVAQGGEALPGDASRPAAAPQGGAISVTPAGVTLASRRVPAPWLSADSAPPSAAPWWAPVASAVVPGAGQFAMRQQRSVAYLVAEGYLLLQAVGARRDGNRQREAYRAVAATVARRPFSTQPAVGDWEYYESMEKFLESGVYDRIPGGGVDPETDVATFNGARWLLARQIYWRDPQVPPPATSPEYQRAMAFYEARAVRDPFRWSWRDAQLEQDVYRQTIAEANRSYQRAVTMTGVVWMNHLISLVDAYVAMRVRRFGGAGIGGVTVGAMETRLVPVPSAAGVAPVLQWQLRLVPTPRHP